MSRKPISSLTPAGSPARRSSACLSALRDINVQPKVDMYMTLPFTTVLSASGLMPLGEDQLYGLLDNSTVTYRTRGCDCHLNMRGNNSCCAERLLLSPKSKVRWNRGESPIECLRAAIQLST